MDIFSVRGLPEFRPKPTISLGRVDDYWYCLTPNYINWVRESTPFAQVDGKAGPLGVSPSTGYDGVYVAALEAIDAFQIGQESVGRLDFCWIVTMGHFRGGRQFDTMRAIRLTSAAFGRNQNT